MLVTGKFVLAWKRGNAILTAGPTKVSPDERIRLVEGYNLEIREVQTNDAGDYICQVATLVPKEITHTLEVLGKLIFLNFTPGQPFWSSLIQSDERLKHPTWEYYLNYIY